jgi:hypothetical protein
MSYTYSFYLAVICSFLHQIYVFPMQWLSPLLKFFYVIYDIKLFYQFDIINKYLSDVKRNLFLKFTEINKSVYWFSNLWPLCCRSNSLTHIPQLFKSVKIKKGMRFFNCSLYFDFFFSFHFSQLDFGFH